jgi:hypothetical protein
MYDFFSLIQTTLFTLLGFLAFILISYKLILFVQFKNKSESIKGFIFKIVSLKYHRVYRKKHGYINDLDITKNQ